MTSFKGRRAIVVGASSGLGMRVARLLLAEGCIVGVAARRGDRLEALRRDYPDTCFTSVIDVNNADAADQLLSLIDTIGGMDLYFHASGIGKMNPELNADIELSTVETNAMGFVRMVACAYSYFANHGGGHIAAITSIAGTKGLGPAPSYSATKALQNTYLEALEQQARSRRLNISFTDLRPGFVRTDLLGDTHFPMELTADFTARRILSALRHRRHVCTIDSRWALVVALWGLIPRWLWRRMKLV